MRKKLSDDAFEIYRSLGPARSYEAVAQRFGVGKRAVVRLAVKEDWQGRLRGVETKENQEEVKRLHETHAELKTRQHKLIRAMQGKALETLKSAPLKTGMDAVRTLDMCLRQERELFEDSASLGEEDGSANSMEAQELPKHSMLEKWLRESPCWQVGILAATGRWGPNDSRSNQKICDLVGYLCGWLERAVMEAKLPKGDPFHVLVLHALALETDPARRTQVIEWILELEMELKAHKARQGSADDRRQWVIGLLPPGAVSVHDALTWDESFGSDHRHPISFVAARLRLDYERKAARQKTGPRPSAEEPKSQG